MFSAFPLASRGDTVTFTAEFGMPNEVMIESGGIPNSGGPDSDVWHVTGSNAVFGGAGPTQFDPDWGTLNSVTVELVGSIDVEWDVANDPSYGWFNPGAFWVNVGFGDPGNTEDTQYAAATPSSDGGVLHAEVYAMLTDLDVNDFIGEDAVVVLLHSELGYGFESMSLTGFDDPLATIGGAAQGMFVGQVIVTYDYTPNP